MQKTAVTRKPS